jgi:hypothetical protein
MRQIILTTLLFLIPSLAGAWGRDGHQMIAAMAESRLTPIAHERAREILNGQPLAAVSVWADVVRPNRRETAPWHYVDIHIDRDDLSIWDCPNNDCVSMIIMDHDALIRRGASLPAIEREEALKFLIHFIGDQAQPLHNANEDDLGGNTKRLTWFGRNTNLHAVWDTGFLRRYMEVKKVTAEEWAEELNREVRNEQIRLWIQGTPIDWSNEAHRIAIEFAYPGWSEELGEAYYEKGIGTVRVQLQKGAIRLAHTLNRLFDPSYKGELSIERELIFSDKTNFPEAAAFQQLVEE